MSSPAQSALRDDSKNDEDEACSLNFVQLLDSVPVAKARSPLALDDPRNRKSAHNEENAATRLDGLTTSFHNNKKSSLCHTPPQYTPIPLIGSFTPASDESTARVSPEPSTNSDLLLAESDLGPDDNTEETITSTVVREDIERLRREVLMRRYQQRPGGPVCRVFRKVRLRKKSGDPTIPARRTSSEQRSGRRESSRARHASGSGSGNCGNGCKVCQRTPVTTNPRSNDSFKPHDDALSSIPTTPKHCRTDSVDETDRMHTSMSKYNWRHLKITTIFFYSNHSLYTDNIYILFLVTNLSYTYRKAHTHIHTLGAYIFTVLF
ncbi:hypothetical protein EDC01DRAFT_191521 [Geopyxis carbonaria]|nr:hypothetical protein EDC01DRAFT_191521 [Geopyxis carbonaria]